MKRIITISILILTLIFPSCATNENKSTNTVIEALKSNIRKVLYQIDTLDPSVKKKIKVIFQLIILLSAIIKVTTLNKEKTSERIINRIETFKLEDQNKECYNNNDNNNKTDAENPPMSKVDTLVYDIWGTLKINKHNKFVNQKNVTKKNVLELLNQIKKYDAYLLIGYRTYTNSLFIKSLNDDEINDLSEEIVLHIKEKGVRDNPV